MIVQVGSDVHGGRIIALDPQTGAERWTWKGKGPGYASPVVVTVGGVTADRHDDERLDRGARREDRRARSGRSPFPDEWHENIVTPIWTGTHLIVSGTRAGTHAYTLRRRRGKWQAAEAWKNADVAMYMSTPVLADGVLYGLSSKKKGQIVAVDAATGALKWATEGRAADQASILLTPGARISPDDRRRARAGRSGPPRNTTKSAATRSPTARRGRCPCVAADGLIVRDASGVMRLTP